MKDKPEHVRLTLTCEMCRWNIPEPVGQALKSEANRIRRVPDYACYTCIPQQVKPDLGILYLGRLELPDQKWTYGNLQIYVVLCWCFYIWHLILRRPIWVFLVYKLQQQSSSFFYTSSSLFLKFKKVYHLVLLLRGRLKIQEHLLQEYVGNCHFSNLKRNKKNTTTAIFLKL